MHSRRLAPDNRQSWLNSFLSVGLLCKQTSSSRLQYHTNCSSRKLSIFSGALTEWNTNAQPKFSFTFFQLVTVCERFLFSFVDGVINFPRLKSDFVRSAVCAAKPSLLSLTSLSSRNLSVATLTEITADTYLRILATDLMNDQQQTERSSTVLKMQTAWSEREREREKNV